MRVRMLGAVVAAGLLAGACANATSGSGAGGGITYPTGGDQLVLRVDVGGGFVAPQTTLTQFPLFSLFGDGLAVSPGAQIEIYPGPALPATVQQRLTPDAIQQILVSARDAGLFESRDFTDLGSVGIADAPTTTFTVVADGRTSTTHVYALGELGQQPGGMSQDEYQARKDLLGFESKVTDLTWLPDGSVSDQGAYQPAGLRVFVGDYQPGQGLTEPPMQWPLSPELADFGQPLPGGAVQGMRCGAVTGADLDTLLPLVEQANQLTPWTSGGSRYGLLFRPLMPDESGC